MSSTPNYGYKTRVDIDAIEMIDRDIKRVEDKADRNSETKVDKQDGHSLISKERLERITHNQNHIECLSKRIDRADSDIADRYTKSEIKTKLRYKADKCELEKHIIDPRAHGELLDGKVDKQDGYGLIPQEQLAQIEINKNDISRMYTQAEVDELLSTKANQNLIINGNFDIWQRGTSQTSSGFGSDDRWINPHQNSSKTHSRQAFAPGQTDVPGNPRFFSRTVVTSVANGGVWKGTNIEDVFTLSGKTVTLSFWAKADTDGKMLALEYRQRFGTDGSAVVFGIGRERFTLTNQWKKYEFTTDIPSIVGKTVGANSHLQLMFAFDDAGGILGIAQSGTFDIAQVKLEEGSVATPFVPRHIAEELALCQRYYEKSYTIDVIPGTVSTSGASVLLPITINRLAWGEPFKVPKRTNPTITIYSHATGASARISLYNNNEDVPIFGIAGSRRNLYLHVQASTGNFVQTAYYAHWVADSEL